MSTTNSKSADLGALTFDAAAVRHAPRTIDTPLDMEWLETVLGQCEYDVTPVAGHCRISAETAADGFRITGSIAVEATAECTTCLADTPLQLNAELDVLLRPAPLEVNKEDELTPEELAQEFFEGDIIQLDEIVSDGILLELPINPRCTHSCRKIQYLVTAEELEQRKATVDPRLQALADIKLSKES